MNNTNFLNEGEEGEEEHEAGVHLATFREELLPFVLIFAFLVVSGVAKMIFHHAHFISSRIPESCLLVLVGVGFGAIIEYGDLTMLPPFTAEFFFHYLLPPIILEAAYSLHHKAFLDNIRTILLFAVVGTAFNFLMIGGLLVGANELGLMSSHGNIRVSLESEHAGHVPLNSSDYHNMTTVEIFTFASLISAVDPVAVLAIFSEVGVNSELYYIVFGESLLNDGVAVVFYNMMNSFAEITAAGDEVTVEQVLLGCASFLTVALGGLTIGIIVGLLTGLATKTTNDVSVIEPLLVMGMAFISYYLAELFHWSGIISLIGCGIVQAHYSFKNVTHNSLITIEYFSKMLSSTMDSVIFLYLGKNLLGWEASWRWNIHAGFLSWTLVFCLVVRFIGVYMFTLVLNRYRLKKINIQEQFIMAYGGLRGAVGFSLVIGIQRQIIPSADMLVSTTLIVVMFTIWLQGGTIKPLVNLLNIDKETDDQRTLMEELNDSMMENVSRGMYHIIGRMGYNHFQNKVDQFDEKYLMNIFSNPDRDHDMKKLFEEIVMKEHLANVYDPKRTIKKTLEFINEGFEEEELKEDTGSLNEFVASQIPPEKNVNLLMPRTRRDSVISNISSRSRSVRVSIYDQSKGDGNRDESDMSNLKRGLMQSMSLQGEKDIEGRYLGVGLPAIPQSRKTSTASGIGYFQFAGRDRTFSEGSRNSNTTSIHTKH